jgi:hypothetical protein
MQYQAAQAIDFGVPETRDQQFSNIALTRWP